MSIGIDDQRISAVPLSQKTVAISARLCKASFPGSAKSHGTATPRERHCSRKNQGGACSLVLIPLHGCFKVIRLQVISLDPYPK